MNQESETLLLHHHHLLLQGFLARADSCRGVSLSLSLCVCVSVALRKIQHPPPPLLERREFGVFPGMSRGARWCVMTVASRVIEL